MGLFAKRVRPSDRAPGIESSSGGGARSWRSDALHVFVLSSFAFSGPLLGLLGERDVYLAHKDFTALVGVMVILCVAFPLLILLAEWLATKLLPQPWGTRGRTGIHAVVVASCLGVLLLQVYKGIPGLPGIVALPLAAISGCVGAALYFRSALWRQVVTFASPGIVLF